MTSTMYQPLVPPSSSSSSGARLTTGPLAPATQPRSLKASLGFIVAGSPPRDILPLPPIRSFSTSSIPIPSPLSPVSSDPALHSTISATMKRNRSRLETLPRNLLTHIAFYLVLDEDNTDPRQRDRKHPSSLIPFFLTSRTVYDAISFDNNPRLYNLLFRATFDTSALTRRVRWMQKNFASESARSARMMDLFLDPRSWAIDYKTRWEQSARMRRVVKLGVLGDVCSREQLEADLWNIWFLLTENDGRNVPFLARECDFQNWIVVYSREAMLKDSLVPGYPVETGEKGLATWCALMSGLDASAELTSAEVDEKIFVMRPYVFACAKYDIFSAPWHHRALPFCPPTCKKQHSNVTFRNNSIPYKRFGYTWRRTPPNFILGVYLTFLRLVERQPGRMGLKPGSTTFANVPNSEPAPGLFSVTRILPSVYHDREWQRNTFCQDPHTSIGLPPMSFAGEIQGFWRGKYLIYDFEMYRQMLAGNIRSVYTGTFAEKAVEMQLKETIVKVRLEEVGGRGELLNAGFDAVVDEEDPELELEQKRIVDGYGHEVCTNLEEPDREGWTKEILISGVTRSDWGYCKVRGRVRAWDGLVILCCAYPGKHPLGKWLWRGYLHTGGHMLGRWRDTFTPENLRGFEGAFGMVRAGDVYYPPHHPTQMDESVGLNGGPVVLPSHDTPEALPRVREDGYGADEGRAGDGPERTTSDKTTKSGADKESETSIGGSTSRADVTDAQQRADEAPEVTESDGNEPDGYVPTCMSGVTPSERPRSPWQSPPKDRGSLLPSVSEVIGEGAKGGTTHDD